MVGLPAIRVRQWLSGWDDVPVNPEEFQSPPPREFFLASIRASQLKALSDTHQRDASQATPRAKDPYVQRTLEEDRTAEIRRYIDVGYPLSSMGSKRLSTEERTSLLKPGWLPTAIIANIITPGEERAGKRLFERDSMSISRKGVSESYSDVNLPESWTDRAWSPEGAYPLEIIDGQHRLSAFDSGDEDFELPVVLFSGLDFAWQAYLFWTVNIKPKRINASLAFDLYPLLRDQKWLEAGESLGVYRETRAQELVEALWRDSRSVWFDRINMLGQSGMKAIRPVTQAAFVRSLTSTFVRPFKGYRGLGGLFGGATDNSGFKWARSQQSAFLIVAWNGLAEAIHQDTTSEWAQSLRRSVGGNEPIISSEDARTDPAFAGDRSLLASDQGVRGFHMVLNDLSYLGQQELGLREWQVDDVLEISPEEQLEESLHSLGSNAVGDFLRSLGKELASFDWRNSRADLTVEERRRKLALRGSGGYIVLRTLLLEHLSSSSDIMIKRLADQALEAHGE